MTVRTIALGIAGPPTPHPSLWELQCGDMVILTSNDGAEVEDLELRLDALWQNQARATYISSPEGRLATDREIVARLALTHPGLHWQLPAAWRDHLLYPNPPTLEGLWWGSLLAGRGLQVPAGLPELAGDLVRWPHGVLAPGDLLWVHTPAPRWWLLLVAGLEDAGEGDWTRATVRYTWAPGPTGYGDPEWRTQLHTAWHSGSAEQAMTALRDDLPSKVPVSLTAAAFAEARVPLPHSQGIEFAAPGSVADPQVWSLDADLHLCRRGRNWHCISTADLIADHNLFVPA